MIPMRREATMCPPPPRDAAVGGSSSVPFLVSTPQLWPVPSSVSSCAPPLPSQHLSHVHAVAVDATGKYLATCSSDRRVNIYTRSLLKKAPKRIATARQQQHLPPPSNNEEHFDNSSSNSSDDDDNVLFADNNIRSSSSTSSTAAHHAQWQHQITLSDVDAPICKVAWAKHDRNVYLAASGGRRTKVYAVGWQRSGGGGSAPGVQPQYRLVANMTTELDGHGDITDIAFCPWSHMDKELILSCASLDGYVRFYLTTEGTKIAPRYAKLCPAEDRMLASAVLIKVGTAVATSYTVGRIHVRSQVPHDDDDADGASSTGYVVTGRIETVTLPEISSTAPPSTATGGKPPSIAVILLRSMKSPSAVTALGWLQTPTDQYSFFMTGTELGTVEGYMLSRRDHKTMFVPMLLTAPSLIRGDDTRAAAGVPSFSQLRLPGAVTCVAWAPGVGRVFDLVAVGTKKGTAILRLYTKKLTTPSPPTASSSGTSTTPNGIAEANGASSALPTASYLVAELPLRAPSAAAWVGEVFFTPHAPCVQAMWDASGTLLSLMDDKEGRQGLLVLHPTDWADHQSWALMSA
ncbi:WD40 repeat-containing protein, putative [Bodo saltans]|uniref:WD40 repeat-containing protein, putative n=1 Tax=Bodo saltans TaxID=75058 RepID=A0A0S4JPY4_BODSA|nr:WD40 repeat-containing protein, putative [Bodo saltans]|eukprot:CUG91443.1 WD40 repeat-containing protein, putative [Bodo saltans]